MARKKNEEVRPAKKSKADGHKRRSGSRRLKNRISLIFPILLAVLGTYLLIMNYSYDTIYRTSSYTKETTDAHSYGIFKNGIIRYNKDGVAFLNRKNEEIWLHSSQFRTPIVDIGKDTFAVADAGGNAIQVFTKDGLKGEIETKLPIEKISVSDQGIVSTILKNEKIPLIVTYDSTGNVLVENQIKASSMGYPTAIELSPNGNVLAVAYLDVSTAAMKTKVICYNFGAEGKTKNNNEVSIEEYADTYIPEIYYMGESKFVAVSDHSFILYEGKSVPVKKKEVEIEQQIKSVFHTDKYIGFILLNEEKSGYKARLYNKNGSQIMNHDFTGEYTNVQMQENEIIMYTGSQCCILTKNGLLRFQGDLRAEALLVLATNGINKYLVMSANELRTIHLLK
ncbi:MAG: DUF5711 family protein [Schaedlerella sp.]|nr:DUF5711 family protein [Schaedlerella sp.]